MEVSIKVANILSQVVLNHRRNGEWGIEENQPLIIMIGGDKAVKAFNPGHTVHILIESKMNYFQVIILFTIFIMRVISNIGAKNNNVAKHFRSRSMEHNLRDSIIEYARKKSPTSDLVVMLKFLLQLYIIPNMRSYHLHKCFGERSDQGTCYR